jgi:hypothetical protein
MRSKIFSTVVLFAAALFCATANDYGSGVATQTGIASAPTYAALFPAWRYHRINYRRRINSVPMTVITTPPPRMS